MREALDENNLSHIPLIAGTGALSTRETIELNREAAEAGATQAMVIAPGYFAGALNREALKEFFVEVAKESPIPVSRRLCVLGSMARILMVLRLQIIIYNCTFLPPSRFLRAMLTSTFLPRPRRRVRYRPRL